MHTKTILSSPWIIYLQWMFGSCFFVIFLAGIFNFLMDPLGVFGSPKSYGINAIKPKLDHHIELTRFINGKRVCATTGIFGNSRAEVGLDPESHVFSTFGFSAFNFGIGGTDSNSVYKQLMWLKAAGCAPDTRFVGVEFFDFLGGSPRYTAPTLRTDPAPSLDMSFFAESVFSVTGLRDSITTFLAQRARYPAIATERGFNPMRNYDFEVAQSGHYALFRQKAEDNVRNWTRKPLRLRDRENEPSANEETLSRILTEATRSRYTTYLIIYPYHAEIRLLIEKLGMGGLFADWKRMVVAAAERETKVGGKVEVWDFSAISQETLEEIPLKGDRMTHLSRYWESGHFKKELGDQMLARMLGSEGTFGSRIDTRNVDRWVTEDRARVQTLLAIPSKLKNEVDSVLAKRVEN